MRLYLGIVIKVFPDITLAASLGRLLVLDMQENIPKCCEMMSTSLKPFPIGYFAKKKTFCLLVCKFVCFQLNSKKYFTDGNEFFTEHHNCYMDELNQV